jgi:GrpB-like predicted nucleotidyltransferase (UPF0157 family)
MARRNPERMDAFVKIEPYNTDWPTVFANERAVLSRVLGPWLAGPIEHVGSTAVPGLPAKPIVDIMAAVESLESSRPALAKLREVGYCYAPYKGDVMHWLCKPSPELRTHHLHLIPFNSELWLERLAFRDLLTANHALANDYAALKLRLAESHRQDRDGYTEAKGPFIQKVLRDRARKP